MSLTPRELRLRAERAFWRLHLLGPHDPRSDPPRFRYLKIENRNREKRARTDGNALPSFPNPGDTGCTFHLFPRLPPELRNMIWTMGCLEPSLVEIHCVDLRCRAQRSDPSMAPLYIFDFNLQHFRSNTPIPPLLSTCKESRSLASHYYCRSSLSSYFCSDAVYFRYPIDTVYISPGDLDSWATRAPYLGLKSSPIPSWSKICEIFGAPLKFWHNLKSIALDFDFLENLVKNLRLEHQLRSKNWTAFHLISRLLRLNHLLVVFDGKYTGSSNRKIQLLVESVCETIRKIWRPYSRGALKWYYHKIYSLSSDLASSYPIPPRVEGMVLKQRGL